MFAAAPPPAAPAPKVPATCRFVDIKDARAATDDPTSFEDDPGIVLAPGRHVAILDVKVVVTQNGEVVGSRSIPRLSTSGTVLRMAPPAGSSSLRVSRGVIQIHVTGTRETACPKRDVDVTRAWRFNEPSLPVRGAPITPFVGDAHRDGLKLVLRSVGGRTSTGVVANVLKDDKLVARRSVGTLEDGGVITVPFPDSLGAGRYTLKVTGRGEGTGKASWSDSLVLGAGSTGGSATGSDAGLTEQKVVVDWSRNRAAGRDTAGFVAPGIGYGEIVCGFKQQHVRFYPTDLNREQSMMLWTYKNWQQNFEKSIRESIHTQFSGPSFQEGMNKFSPPEKHMTGEYEGVIADRGVLEAPFGASLAPPTTIDLTWVWDFSDPRNSRCHVEATLRTETAASTAPLARSAQVVWRGTDNAAGHDTASTEIPGVGTMTVVCEAARGATRDDGTRTVTIAPASGGGSVVDREGGDDKETPVESGPLVAQLPNNGMLKLKLAAGGYALVSSRWKVNDPLPGENSCRVAAQYVTS